MPPICLRVAALAVRLTGSAFASQTFVANLTNGEGNPPTNPTASTRAARPASFETATFVLNDAQTARTMSATSSTST